MTLTLPISLYCGRKSWPHWLTQCACSDYPILSQRADCQRVTSFRPTPHAWSHSDGAGRAQLAGTGVVRTSGTMQASDGGALGKSLTSSTTKRASRPRCFSCCSASVRAALATSCSGVMYSSFRLGLSLRSSCANRHMCLSALLLCLSTAEAGPQADVRRYATEQFDNDRHAAVSAVVRGAAAHSKDAALLAKGLL